MTEHHQEPQEDVWPDVFLNIKNVAEAVEQALQAFDIEGNDKVISATTRKRISAKALQSLADSRQRLERLRILVGQQQDAARQYERSVQYASTSHRELLDQLEDTTTELHKAMEKARTCEEQRLAAWRDLEQIREELAILLSSKQSLEASLKQRMAEVESYQFGANQSQAQVTALMEENKELKRVAEEAHSKAQQVVKVMEVAQGDREKARAVAERHQETVAKLIADNTVFIFQLKKLREELEVANKERANLHQAVEEQRGPWFEEMRAGVEVRVKAAMSRAEELEKALEAKDHQHKKELDALQSEKCDLEQFLTGLRQQQAELEEQLQQAQKDSQDSRCQAEEDRAATIKVSKQAEDQAAEIRVMQETLKNMRTECTERWVAEQAALGTLEQMESKLKEEQGQVLALQQEVSSLSDQLALQRGINHQLMLKKEEVEWQLMAAVSKGGAVAANPSISLTNTPSTTSDQRRSKSTSTEEPHPEEEPQPPPRLDTITIEETVPTCTTQRTPVDVAGKPGPEDDDGGPPHSEGTTSSLDPAEGWLVLESQPTISDNMISEVLSFSSGSSQGSRKLYGDNPNLAFSFGRRAVENPPGTSNFYKSSSGTFHPTPNAVIPKLTPISSDYTTALPLSLEGDLPSSSALVSEGVYSCSQRPKDADQSHGQSHASATTGTQMAMPVADRASMYLWPPSTTTTSSQEKVHVDDLFSKAGVETRENGKKARVPVSLLTVAEQQAKDAGKLEGSQVSNGHADSGRDHRGREEVPPLSIPISHHSHHLSLTGTGFSPGTRADSGSSWNSGPLSSSLHGILRKTSSFDSLGGGGSRPGTPAKQVRWSDSGDSGVGLDDGDRPSNRSPRMDRERRNRSAAHFPRAVDNPRTGDPAQALASSPKKKAPMASSDIRMLHPVFGRYSPAIITTKSPVGQL